MKRLLGEMLSGKSPSTGVVEKSIQVAVEKSSFGIVSASVDSSKWTRLSHEDEAIDTITKVASDQSSTRHILENQSCFQEVIEKIPVPKVLDSNIESSNKKESTKEILFQDNIQLPVTASKEDAYVSTELPFISVQQVENVCKCKPLIFFKRALKNKDFLSLHQYHKQYWSLHLSNTGGQIEFQELLPFLVSGPSLFIVTFRLDQDLNQRYEIEYSVAGDTSAECATSQSFKYTSSTTQLENILRILASIGTMGTYSHSGHCWEQINYKVLIVGTHYDVLENANQSLEDLQSKIDEIDQTIQRAVQNFKQYICFADENRIIFTVNNFSTKDNDFHNIRSSIQGIVDSGFFEIQYPSHWLIYDMMLRHYTTPISEYDTCFEIAKECGIKSHDEHKEALHFMHTRTSTIRYFPDQFLSNLIFSDPSILFNKITELIFQTFTFKTVGKYSVEEFQCKGIFKFVDYMQMSNKKDPTSPLTPLIFMKLLEHLRITAPFMEDGALKYFLPCALSHVREPQEGLTSGILPPLVRAFECGYCPMGVGYALVKYLMTNEMRSSSQWKFLPGEVYRNQVSFEITPTYDIVVLKIMSTHLEIQLLCANKSTNLERDMKPTCTKVCAAIEAGIKKITTDIKYIHNINSEFTFYCDAEECKLNQKHPARMARSQTTNKPLHLVCQMGKQRQYSDLPEGWEYWWLGMCRQDCSPSDHATLLKQLKQHADKWREIGTYLGFTQGELDYIQAGPLHLSQAPVSWLSEMIRKWLDWAPGDHRGSTQYANLESFQTSIRDAGLEKTAEELTLHQ